MSAVNYFPFPSFRPLQKEIIERIEAVLDTTDWIMCEAPVGFGKSAVVYALAKFMWEEYGELTHFIVNDIYLQEQYLRDFHDIALIKGRGNFPCSEPLSDLDSSFGAEAVNNVLYADRAPCTLINNYVCPYKPKHVVAEDDTPFTGLELGGGQGFDPDELERKVLRDKFGVRLNWEETTQPWCQYWVQKDKAIHSPLTIHNYHYFLYEQNYAHSFTQRNLGIYDEAHTIESILMDFVKVEFTQRTLDRIWRFATAQSHTRIPEYAKLEEWISWLGNERDELKSMIARFGTAEDVEDLANTSDNVVSELKNRKMMYHTYERVGYVLQELKTNPDNWVFIKDYDKITFKPVVVSDYGKMLFKHTKKHILISATILDKQKLQTYLGIEDEVKFFRINESTFPVKNRPLYQKFAGKAIYGQMDQYLVNMLNVIDSEILPTRYQYKGVIHTHTGDIARYILTRSKFKEHMMTNVATKDDLGNYLEKTEKREEIFQQFFDSPAPKIMVTPSMRMGIDLHDDLARWQIICKVPYPFLGDPQIKRRVEIDQTWYDYTTAVSVVQTYGRICRSVDDWGASFILDGKFQDLYYRNQAMFPRWFREALR